VPLKLTQSAFIFLKDAGHGAAWGIYHEEGKYYLIWLGIQSIVQRTIVIGWRDDFLYCSLDFGGVTIL
jgi:hypothetical protein